MQNTADYFSHQNRKSCSNFSNQVPRRNTKKSKSKWRKIFSPKRSDLMKWTICFFVSCLIAMDASGNFLVLTLEEYANNPFGNVIFLRHAFAPGMDANGKPAKFKIDDCSTQRNLDSTGRKQATIIGEKFSETGIKFGAIYSSQWCRCLETARLLNLGEVFPDVSLNSGFKGLFSEQENLSKLRKNLESLRNKKVLILMITHQGIISAITGIGVKSGGAVAYNVKTKTAKIIAID
jgi:broad specificity phosphatase PhoE